MDGAGGIEADDMLHKLKDGFVPMFAEQTAIARLHTGDLMPGVVSGQKFTDVRQVSNKIT